MDKGGKKKFLFFFHSFIIFYNFFYSLIILRTPYSPACSGSWRMPHNGSLCMPFYMFVHTLKPMYLAVSNQYMSIVCVEVLGISRYVVCVGHKPGNSR